MTKTLKLKVKKGLRKFPRGRFLFGPVPQIQAEVLNLLERAGFVVGEQSYREDQGYDLVTERNEFGRQRKYLVEIKLQNPLSASSVRSAVETLDSNRQISELWLVAQAFSRAAQQLASEYPSVQLLTLEKLETSLSEPKTKKQTEPRTSVGKAIIANEAPLTNIIGALTITIEYRLKSLQAERPNSPESKSARDVEIAQYQKLQSDLADSNKS